MGLIRSRFSIATSFLVFAVAAQLYAAPKLRLDKTAIGPIPVALNQNGPSQTVNASNAGDAALRLTAASSATWLSATVQPLQPCGTLGNCNPITIGLNTAALAKGSYTGFVTISDPNSIDAPQTISVTVLAGGGVPDNLTFFVPANGNAVRQTFTTARQVNTAITQPTPANLSIAAPSSGSFASTITYTVSASAAAGVAAGNYSGAINVSGSTIPTENKNVPVTVTVTSQPIASLGTINPFRIAQGSAKQTQYIVPSNPGSGTLTLASATATTTSGAWLTAAIVNGLAAVSADPTGLAPGSYTGTVTVTSNAANNSIAVPVQLQVIPSGPPVATAGGVLNNATYSTGDTLAQGDLPAIFGEQLIAGDVQVQGAPPWSTTLGGATVYINDTPAPVWYVSANQINFQIPYDAATGDATLRVDRDGQRGNTVSIRIGKSAPKLLVATGQDGSIASRPFAGSAAPVTAGSYITIYALGLGQTNPPVTAGTASPSSPLATVPGTNQVFFGNGGLFQNPVSMTPQFIGLTPGFSGLYQINVQIPDNAPRGPAVPVFLQGDIGTSNVLTFNIQ